MHKLRSQILLSYIPLILAPVLLVGLVTRDASERGLTLFIDQARQQQATMVAGCVVSYYQQYGSWDDFFNADQTRIFAVPVNPSMQIIFVQGDLANNRDCFAVSGTLRRGMITGQPRNGSTSATNRNGTTGPQNPSGGALNPAVVPIPGMPLIQGPAPRGLVQNGDILIADPEGTIIAPKDAKTLGQKLSPQTLAKGAPIIVDGKTLGTLVIAPEMAEVAQQQSEPLTLVNTALLTAIGISVVLAVGLGWWLAYQISNPVQQLMNGVKSLASGRWTTPLPVRSRNEFGQLTQAFNSMAGEITRQQQLNRQMIADIAHDLRTPLTAMSLELEAIDAGFQTPADAATSLREEIVWLQRLVDDLRLLSLMDADQIHLQRENTLLYTFLCGVFDFWETMATEDGRLLNLAWDDHMTVQSQINIDPNRMRQVLGNLLDNAIRHTRPGQRITLGARAESDHVLLWVSDEGEGIPPEELPHIFDRFYRTDPSRKRHNNGSGLGLSIASRFVELHNGTITVTSNVGEGTTFTISLPRS